MARVPTELTRALTAGVSPHNATDAGPGRSGSRVSPHNATDEGREALGAGVLRTTPEICERGRGSGEPRSMWLRTG